jgi:hypothetical protein
MRLLPLYDAVRCKCTVYMMRLKDKRIIEVGEISVRNNQTKKSICLTI